MWSLCFGLLDCSRSVCGSMCFGLLDPGKSVCGGLCVWSIVCWIPISEFVLVCVFLVYSIPVNQCVGLYVLVYWIPVMPYTDMTCADVTCNGRTCTDMPCTDMTCNGMTCSDVSCNGMTCPDVTCAGGGLPFRQ